MTCQLHHAAPTDTDRWATQQCARPVVETLVFCNPNISDLPVCAAHLAFECAEGTLG